MCVYENNKDKYVYVGKVLCFPNLNSSQSIRGARLARLEQVRQFDVFIPLPACISLVTNNSIPFTMPCAIARRHGPVI